MSRDTHTKSAQSIFIETTLTPKAFTDFSRFNAFSVNGRGILFALFPFAMIGMGIVHLLTGSRFFFYALAGAGILIPILYLLFFRRAVRTQIRANGLETPKIAYRVRLGAEGLSVSNDRENAEYGWDRVYKAYLCDEYVYLYMTPSKAFILPYGNIAEGTGEGLDALLRGQLPKERIASKKRKVNRR